MLYKLTTDLANALADDEYSRVRDIISKWPKNRFVDMLAIISAVMTTKDIEVDKEIAKALMVFACEYDDMDDVWNLAMTDEVPIHCDGFKPFLTACKHNNISMVCDFRRFQYDEEDGSNIIPIEIWQKGLEIAEENVSLEVAQWIRDYLENGTDEELESDSDMTENDDLDPEEQSRISNAVRAKVLKMREQAKKNPGKEN